MHPALQQVVTGRDDFAVSCFLLLLLASVLIDNLRLRAVNARLSTGDKNHPRRP